MHACACATFDLARSPASRNPQVFSLIITNAAQLAVNTLVRTILTLLQLVAVPLACYQMCEIALTSRGSFEPFYPSVIVGLIALVITNVFTLVFGCVLDTLFVCTVRDKAEYKGAFMSDRLYEAYGFDPKDRPGGGGGGDGDKGKKADAPKEETKQTI